MYCQITKWRLIYTIDEQSHLNMYMNSQNSIRTDENPRLYDHEMLSIVRVVLLPIMVNINSQRDLASCEF